MRAKFLATLSILTISAILSSNALANSKKAEVDLCELIEKKAAKLIKADKNCDGKLSKRERMGARFKRKIKEPECTSEIVLECRNGPVVSY